MNDQHVDILLAQGELPQGLGDGTGVHKDATLAELDRRSGQTGTPIVIFSLANQNVSEAGRALRDTFEHIGFVQGPDQAVSVVAMLRRLASLDGQEGLPADPTQPALGDTARGMVLDRPRDQPWSEVDSKALLVEYGIEVPREIVVTSATEAVKAADAIGYPVTLKVVLEGIGHKTEIGGVLLRLTSPTEIAEGYGELERRAAQHGLSASFRGVLVADHVEGGLELALGVHRDVEMGPVVMVGLGGVWLEVVKSVAFGPVPLGDREAEDLIAATRAYPLLMGFRGGPVFDRMAAVAALVALSRLAHDCGDLIESVDVNPFTVLQAGKGAVALDALVVPRLS